MIMMLSITKYMKLIRENNYIKYICITLCVGIFCLNKCLQRFELLYVMII